MGMKLEIIESKGPTFDDPLRSLEDVRNLDTAGVTERLQYVMDAIALTKEKLAGRVPLIGFSGAPWTLATYMVEGKGTRNFDIIKSFIYNEPAAAHQLLQTLADAVVDYLNAKIRAGCDAVQIFDTWAGILSPSDAEEFSLRYIRYICENLETRGAPVIVFAKGVNAFDKLAELKCDVIGLDWTQDIGKVRREIGGKKALQGNLDPCVLFAPKDTIKDKVREILDAFGGEPGHVFNLGHGILPNTPAEKARYLVECVKELSSKRNRVSQEVENFSVRTATTKQHEQTRNG
jgi:uroporphyrinogen decarboxylase